MRIVAAGFVPVLVGIAQLLSPKGLALGVPTPLLESYRQLISSKPQFFSFVWR